MNELDEHMLSQIIL